MRGRPVTLGELKKSGGGVRTVKEELRQNLIRLTASGEPLFPGIIGYDRTVIPQIVNAILARHDFILLGLRGQAKSRLLRGLTQFLDETVPVVMGCDINDNPFQPICKRCRKRAEQKGDELDIAWLPREERFREKLATPDVTMADLIGDIDPIKAAKEKLTYSDEEAIHFGIIPRTNRGIFAINELPDLHARIQVGLLNIMEERELQIRGFPVRLPLDIMIVYSANPEDYTNRGNIITPLKDRIDSQIMTHYPETVAEAMEITRQEAWLHRGDICEIVIPEFVREIVERIAFEARRSEFVDQSSGVSARATISAMECMISNIEKRALRTGERRLLPRICDLHAVVPALSGKIELVYEGEQQGVIAVSKRIIGQATKKAFDEVFPNAYKSKTPNPTSRPSKSKAQGPNEANPGEDNSPYRDILRWFAQGNAVDLSDDMTHRDYVTALEKVPGLEALAAEFMKPKTKEEHALVMEFVLEGLYQNSLIAKEEGEDRSSYKDMLKTMFEHIEDK